MEEPKKENIAQQNTETKEKTSNDYTSESIQVLGGLSAV